VQLEDLPAHPVHELPVVGHQEQGTRPTGQLLGEELHPDEVEVVGGLIEKEQRRQRD
jgi:hypothetical protein